MPRLRVSHPHPPADVWRVLVYGLKPAAVPRWLRCRETAFGYYATCDGLRFWVSWNDAGDPYIDLAYPIPSPPEAVNP